MDQNFVLIFLNLLNFSNFLLKGVPSDNVEVWFLDRSLQWHFLANSFTNYYRLVISHLGLPQWQLLFTQDGLPPMLYVTTVFFFYLDIFVPQILSVSP